MNVSSFIENLKGDDPIAELEIFNTYIEENKTATDVIYKFLHATKNCEEILDLLTVKQDAAELAAIFTALSHILLNIAGELSEFNSIGLHITQQILHNHDASMYKLLGPSNSDKNSKTVLRCLTGIVMLGGEAANKVLLTVDWKRVNISHVVNRQSLQDIRDVRAWCIYLFLAFLNVPDDPHCVLKFLKKKDLLSAIFPGLVWDPCERVINVLKVLQEKVLLNPNVSKTLKMNIFTPITSKPLLDLYDWMGPIGKMAEGNSVLEMDIQIVEDIQRERSQIKDMLQKFLLTLYSAKYGIVFTGNLQYGENNPNNMHIFNAVSMMKTPWENPEGRELISCVLGTCPDLLMTYLLSIKDVFSPSPTQAYINLVDMLVQIIEHQKPWKNMNTKGLEGVLALLLPQPLDHQLLQSLVESCYKTLRHSGLKLVLAILSKTKETIENILKNKSLSQQVKQQTQRELIEAVFKIQMTVDSIIHCWNIATGQEVPDIQTDENRMIQSETADPVPAIIELLTIVKVLTYYSELLPNQTLHKAINPLEMLQTARVLPCEDVNCVTNVKAKLELQVLCLGFLECSIYSEDLPTDSSLSMDGQIKQMDKDAIYQLICMYAQSKEEFVVNENESVMLSVADKCLDILSNFLVKVGLSFHYNSDIKIWLRCISSTGIVKLSIFLTQIIQKTVSSLSHYTDLLVELGTKHHLNTNNLGQIYSFMRELEAVEVVDNEDIAAHSISPPFSRLILAAVDLLGSYPDSEYIQYFSSVINDYLHSMSDPGFIADILLQNENILTSDLQDYLRCLFKEPKYRKDKYSSSIECVEKAGLSEILKYMFMSHNWSYVESLLLKGNKFKELMAKTDIDLIVSQLLLYLYLDSNTEKSGTKIVKKYIYIIKHMSTVLENDGAEQVIQIVLEHPYILANYKPFSSKKSPVTELAQEFIKLALEEHFKLAPKSCLYFEKIVKDIKIEVANVDTSVDFWNPLAPFILSKKSLVSYEAIEKLLVICLEAPSQTCSLDTLILELINLLIKSTSAKRKCATQSVQLMLARFLDWSKSSSHTATQERILKDLEKLLTLTLKVDVAFHLSPDEMKCLASAQPPCAALCCHLVRLHPPHGVVLAKYLKRHRTILPAQASLLAMLLEKEECLSTAEAALAKVADVIKMWALDMDGDDDDDDDTTGKLLALALKKGMIDENCMSKICCQLYEKVITKRQSPPKLLALIPVFYKLSEVGPILPKFDLPEEHIALLHICLKYIQSTYQKELRNTSQLMNVSKIINKILPKLDEHSLRSTLATNKLWPSFVKQVLRIGLGDQNLGPQLLHILSLLCEVLYKKESQRKLNEEKNILPVTTLYQLIIAHTQYLPLMFNKAKIWGRLKEQVIALQQTLVECEECVCREYHIPILLGAYEASMSAVDQRILKLLYTYERKGYMYSCQPVLWSDAAIAHFGVESSGFCLFKEPSPEQILGLLDMERLMQTCYTFDTRLSLEPIDVQKEDPSVYDMRFLIPLMLYLAEKNMPEIDYAEYGAVAIGFIAMTSHQRDVWGAGAAILRCMVEKMEKSSHQRLKLPWMWLVGVVSYALEGKQRRLPALTTHFLIRASQLLSQPRHPMYQPVLNYLFLKPAFKLYYVPELFEFFSSAHVQHNREHRSFLLTTLATGIRQILDYSICQRTFTSTLVISMLQAPSVDTKLRVQALEVIEAMVCIPLGAVELTANQNLLTVLPLVVLPGHTVIHKLDALRETASSIPILAAAVVKVLSALWSTLMHSITREDYSDKNHIDEPEDTVLESEDKVDKKRKFNETFPDYRKKSKKESIYFDSDTLKSSSEVLYTELNSETISSKTLEPRKKRLPSLFVHEFINCLTLLVPTILEYASPAVTGKHLWLIAQSVQYVDTVIEYSSKTRKLCAVAMAPEVIKQQIYDQINWDLLYNRLQEHLSSEDEVRLLGSKVKDMWNKWQSEPLNQHLQKEERTAAAEENREEEHQYLKQSVLTLLSTLGK